MCYSPANRTIEYWVLDTDYSSYSLVYSCENLDATRRRGMFWNVYIVYENKLNLQFCSLLQYGVGR